MAEISVGAAVGSGFALIGRKPLTVLSWGLLRFGLLAAMFALFAPFFVEAFRTAAERAQHGATQPPDPAAILPRMMMLQGLSYLLQIVQALVVCVVYCAAWRAILHPERTRFGYLRVGAPELLLVLLAFAAGMVFVFGLLILIIPIAIVVGVLAAIHLAPVAVAVGVLAALALAAGLLYIGLRFSFVGPMMVQDGKFHLFESWTMTRGRAGRLFFVGLSLFGILILAELAVVIVAVAVGAAALGVAAGGFGNLSGFFHLPPMEIVRRLAPLLAIYALASIPLQGCAVAIAGAPWAKAYQDMLPDSAEAFS